MIDLILFLIYLTYPRIVVLVVGQGNFRLLRVLREFHLVLRFARVRAPVPCIFLLVARGQDRERDDKDDANQYRRSTTTIRRTRHGHDRLHISI